jgi:hypothetical protein
MGLFSFFTSAANSGISISDARELVSEALQDALDTMEDMVGNEGQQSVFNSYVAPAFREAKGPIKDGWEDVDIGEYMDFMGEIVEEGNSIMSEAYEEAQDILSELEEEAEQRFEEE